MWGCAVELASALAAATILADATITVSKMTYNVLSGTLNHTLPYSSSMDSVKVLFFLRVKVTFYSI